MSFVVLQYQFTAEIHLQTSARRFNRVLTQHALAPADLLLSSLHELLPSMEYGDSPKSSSVLAVCVRVAALRSGASNVCFSRCWPKDFHWIINADRGVRRGVSDRLPDANSAIVTAGDIPLTLSCLARPKVWLSCQGRREPSVSLMYTQRTRLKIEVPCIGCWRGLVSPMCQCMKWHMVFVAV